jgi:hypothetical protein
VTPAFRPGTTRTAYSLNRSTKFIDSIRRKHHGPSAPEAAKEETPKEKKAIKQQKRHAGEAVPLIHH